MEEAQKATIKQLHALQLKYDELDLEKSRLLGNSSIARFASARRSQLSQRPQPSNALTSSP